MLFTSFCLVITMTISLCNVDSFRNFRGKGFMISKSSEFKMVIALNPSITVSSSPFTPMRPRLTVSWQEIRQQLANNFQLGNEELVKYDHLSKDDSLKAYEMMLLCRNFENACNQAYMQGKIRGFMHLDNGQETIPAFVADTIKKGDKKHSYYREHTHAIASDVSADKIMAELFAKVNLNILEL